MGLKLWEKLIIRHLGSKQKSDVTYLIQTIIPVLHTLQICLFTEIAASQIVDTNSTITGRSEKV